MYKALTITLLYRKLLNDVNHKEAATFGDLLAVVGRHLLGNFTFPTSPAVPDVVLVPRLTLSRIAQAVCY